MCLRVCMLLYVTHKIDDKGIGNTNLFNCGLMEGFLPFKLENKLADRREILLYVVGSK